MAGRPRTPDDVTVRDAEVRYLNFEGRETMYKPKGYRSFQLLLPEDVAEEMAQAGWNVKRTKPRKDATPEEIADFDPRPFLEVKVNFKYEDKAPQIRLITDVQTILSEETAFLVDQADIIKMDLVINASFYDMGGNTGFTTYLKKAFITIQEDDLEKEYSHIPIEGTTRV